MVNPQRQLGIPLGKLLEEEVVREFATGLRGELIRPEDNGYDAARAVSLSSSHPTKLSKQATNASINTSNITTSSYRCTLTTPRSRANG